MSFLTCILGPCIKEHFVLNILLKFYELLKLEDSARILIDFMACILGSCIEEHLDLKILLEFDELWNLKIQQDLMNFMTFILGSCNERSFWFEGFARIWWALRLEDSSPIWKFSWLENLVRIWCASWLLFFCASMDFLIWRFAWIKWHFELEFDKFSDMHFILVRWWAS